MHCLRSIAPAATILILGLFITSQGLAAPDKIGGATSVQRDVLGSLPGQERKVAEGDDVFREETIRTASASAAALTFLDETNLRVGPLASVKLDRFVFNPDRSVKAIAITMTKGAMRWVSGVSASRAYVIRTPQVVIGVRGTIFDLWTNGRRTVVLLQEGSVEVCTAGSRRTCRMLNRRGDVISVSGGAMDGPRPGGPGPSEFASRCLSATGQLCTITIAGAEPAPLKQGTTRLAAKPREIEEPPHSPAARTEASPPQLRPARRAVSVEPRTMGSVVREAVVPPELRPRGGSVRTYRPRHPRVVDIDIYRPRRSPPWPGRADVYEDGKPDGYDERHYGSRRVLPPGYEGRSGGDGSYGRGQARPGFPPYGRVPSRRIPGPYGSYGDDGGGPAGGYGPRGGVGGMGGPGRFGGVGGAGGAGGSAY